MKRQAILAAAILAAATTLAADTTSAAAALDEKTEKLVRQSLPVCTEMTLTSADYGYKFPQGLSGRIIRSESPSPACAGQWLLVTSSGGSYYLGSPWFIAESPGATTEEKLQNFSWQHLKTNISATVERKRTSEGLFRATLLQTTESGKVPMEGVVDPDGRVFFLGEFQPMAADPAKSRMSALQPLIANAPARGAAQAEVTLVEFSDFQCPSCKYSSSVGETIIARYGERARYIRFDLPLITSHPWAFGAALVGRAIYRQNPDLFWEYKKQVYENQERLNAFTFDDFARAFAEDRGLDMQRYDADLQSAAVREELLKGIGAAFSNQVRATPTFMVNGVFVDSGPEGTHLQAYIDGLLKE